jgi:uncharacterized membrane protein
LLAKTDSALYKSGMLDASLKGVNTTFMFVIAITVIALIMSFFLKDKKKSRVLVENSNDRIEEKLAV